MSLEPLDYNDLRELDLPKSVVSRRGLSDIDLQKIVYLVYQVNKPKVGIDVEDDFDFDGSGKRRLVVPSNERWSLQALYIEVTATGTVGTRNFVLSIRDGTTAVIYKFWSSFTVTASQSKSMSINAGNGSGADIHRQISFHIDMGPAWDVFLNELNAVDSNDAVLMRAHIERSLV